MDINNDVKAAIDFVGSYVKKLNLDFFNPPTGTQELKAEMKINYSLGEITKTEDCILGPLELSIQADLFEENKPFAKCRLQYEGLFKADLNLPEETFRQMLELNGVMILYQLSRSLITSITAQAGLFPPLTLPLINVHKVIETQREANKSGTVPNE
jgi:preprotein translocase subunit SecB